jgi:zinc transporter ZupT
LNYGVTYFLGGHHHHYHPAREDRKNDTQPISNAEESVDVGAGVVTHTHKTPHMHTEDVQAGCPCCSDDPVRDLEGVHLMAAQIEEFETREHHQWDEKAAAQSQNGSDRGSCCDHSQCAGDDKDEDQEEAGGDTTPEGEGDSGSEENEEEDDHVAVENKKLMRMSINTAVAIGLHNFPEGLATFVAALNDTRVGGVLAIAIAIHNIPEGLCVAMPIYYATGNRWKAFGWAVLSGASEPLAALLGWAILANSFSDDMYAVLFGLVAGMMVIISVRELLPTAHRYDPEDTVVTYSFMIGMAIMAVSLVLFTL